MRKPIVLCSTGHGLRSLVLTVSVAIIGVFAYSNLAEAGTSISCDDDSDCAEEQTCEKDQDWLPGRCTCDTNEDCPYSSPVTCREDGLCYKVDCGDGYLDRGEACDDGVNNSDSAPDHCRTDCRLPYCGDDVVDSGEECDDGALNSDFQPDVCRQDCTPPECGDGITDPGLDEQCDEGPQNSNLPDAECSLRCIIPGCGNGVEERLEGCDDNNIVDTDDCTDQCRHNVCGDGSIWVDNEQCEYDTPWNPAGCRYDCGQDPSSCGNSTIDPGEGCDEGSDTNGDEPDYSCRSDCQPQRCGDGIVDSGEQCDSQAGCSPDCAWIAPR